MRHRQTPRHCQTQCHVISSKQKICILKLRPSLPCNYVKFAARITLEDYIIIQFPGKELSSLGLEDIQDVRPSCESSMVFDLIEGARYSILHYLCN